MTFTDAKIDLTRSTWLQDAQTAIDAFEQSTVPGQWRSLDKATLIADLRSRLTNPLAISQGEQPFCGPASVLFELVRHQPHRYIQLCQQLFETGQFQGTTRLIQASEALRHNGDQNLRMPQADWMVLSTLRESENVLFPVEPNSPDLMRNLAGMTKSWEIKGWLSELLGYRTIEYHPAYLLSDFSALNAAIAAHQNGGSALLLITADGMLNTQIPLIPYPNHWVTFLGNAVVTSDRVSFDIYTWSKQVRIDLECAAFKKYFWASVTGM